jgi:hypothetical protein
VEAEIEVDFLSNEVDFSAVLGKKAHCHPIFGGEIMSQRWIVALSFVLGAVGCSSSDSGSTTPSDTGSSSDVSTDAGSDTKVTADTAPVDTAPGVCWFIQSSRPEQLPCDVCSEDKCKTQREACFGTDYLKGSYGTSPCADYIKCQCSCTEADAICQEGCKVGATAACNTCLGTIDTCEKANCASTCYPPK